MSRRTDFMPLGAYLLWMLVVWVAATAIGFGITEAIAAATNLHGDAEFALGWMTGMVLGTVGMLALDSKARP